MSFNTLKKPQLEAVAEGFGLDVPEKATVADLKTAINEADYIEWDQAVAILKDAELWTEKDEEEYQAARAEAIAEQAAKPKDTVIRMRRANKSYEILGYRFTQANPYALTTAEDAETITDLDPEGFNYATPKEVAEFYG